MLLKMKKNIAILLRRNPKIFFSCEIFSKLILKNSKISFRYTSINPKRIKKPKVNHFDANFNFFVIKFRDESEKY
jgi:hypothetical protein